MFVHHGAIKREISLSALDDAAVRHNTGVTRRTGEHTNLDLSLLSNHIAVERQNTIGPDGRTGALIPLRITHVKRFGFFVVAGKAIGNG